MTREFKSINPHNGEELARYREHGADEVHAMLEKSKAAFSRWREVPLAERCRLLAEAAAVLRRNAEKYARTITLEMGKPIRESRAEVEKCAWVCDYYAERAESFLAPEHIATDADESYVRCDPIGAVLAIMPWNFPFWQVIRFAAPTLTAGNTGLLKHASNVFGCATHIEELFREAGFPDGVFQNLLIGHGQIETIIASDAVMAVTLTGSEAAGSSVAAIAGRELKKSLLELGGSNAFILWPDADLDKAVATAVTARMLNAGQSCIAAKRFIVVESIYDEFAGRLAEAMGALRAGDPIDEATQVGPLARADLAEELQQQVSRSIEAGARLLLGGGHKGAYFEPTVLGAVTPGMPAFDEETFGPVAAIVRARDEDHAFELANMSSFGLGLTLCTADLDKARGYAERVADGAFFVNELVKSDPRLPFGGTKRSGYGRELARDGMLEFVNRKTVYMKRV